MSPRYIAQIAPSQPASEVPPLDIRLGEQRANEKQKCSPAQPYVRGCPHSFFEDLLRVSQHQQRSAEALESPVLRGRDQGPLEPDAAHRDDPLQEVRNRLSRIANTTWVERRALSSSNAADMLRPSAPSYLSDIFGQASRQSGTLVDAIGAQPLEPGMVDTSSGVPVLSIPRLTSGAAVAVQSSQNSAIQETDPATASVSSPIATVAGQSDYSRQLLDFSRPGMDEVIADDLGRDFGTKLDIQIVNGSGSSGQTRGLLAVSGILSVAGSVSSVQAFIDSVWDAYAALAGSSGIGNPDPDAYLTILHPRRYAWLHSGAGATSVPGAPTLPGRVVLSAGVPVNLGAGTNEDVALLVERSNLVLALRRPTFRVDEDTGSSTLTVRTFAWANVSLLTKNAAGVAKVTGLTPP